MGESDESVRLAVLQTKLSTIHDDVKDIKEYVLKQNGRLAVVERELSNHKIINKMVIYVVTTLLLGGGVAGGILKLLGS